MNLRTDEYGGGVENRARFGCEIISGIREACGKDFIISARTPGAEPTLADASAIADAYIEAGVDFLQISGGIGPEEVPFPDNLPYGWIAWSGTQMFRHVAGRVPVPVVNGILDPALARRMLNEGLTDAVDVCRGLLADPAWARAGDRGRRLCQMSRLQPLSVVSRSAASMPCRDGKKTVGIDQRGFGGIIGFAVGRCPTAPSGQILRKPWAHSPRPPADVSSHERDERKGYGMKIIDLKCAEMGENLVLRVVTDKGIDGYGQTEINCKYLKPLVPYYKGLILGSDPTDVERTMLRIRNRGGFKPWGQAGQHHRDGTVAILRARMPVCRSTSCWAEKIRDEVLVYKTGYYIHPDMPHQNPQSAREWGENIVMISELEEGFTMAKLAFAYHGLWIDGPDEGLFPMPRKTGDACRPRV